MSKSKDDMKKVYKLIDAGMDKLVASHKFSINGIIPSKKINFSLVNLSLNYNRVIVGMDASLLKHYSNTKKHQKTFSMILMDGKKHSIRLNLLKSFLNKDNPHAIESFAITSLKALKNQSNAVILDKPQLHGFKVVQQVLLQLARHYDHNKHNVVVISDFTKKLNQIDIYKPDIFDTNAKLIAKSKDHDRNGHKVYTESYETNGVTSEQMKQKVTNLMVTNEVPVSIVENASSHKVNHTNVILNLYTKMLNNSVIASLYNYVSIYNGLFSNKKSLTYRDADYKLHHLSAKSLRKQDAIAFSDSRTLIVVKSILKALSTKSKLHEICMSDYMTMIHCLNCTISLAHDMRAKKWLVPFKTTRDILQDTIQDSYKQVNMDLLMEKSKPILETYNDMTKKHYIGSIGKNISKVGSSLIGTLNMSNASISMIVTYCFKNYRSVLKAIKNHNKTVKITTLDLKDHRINLHGLMKMMNFNLTKKGMLSSINDIADAYNNFNILLFDDKQVSDFYKAMNLMATLEYYYGNSIPEARECNMLYMDLRLMSKYLLKARKDNQ